jgi:calcineurin-like phosphoesterase family protein
MNVLFCTDPHLLHKNIHKFRHFIDTPEQNTELFLKEAKRKLNKRTLTFFLGDVAFEQAGLDIIAALPGRKILIKGNHDNMTSTAAQMEVFEEIHGCIRYKQYFLSHCPIHPDQLFNHTANIHGHVHHLTVMDGIKEDRRYINLCPENRKQYFTSLQEVRAFWD